MMDLTNRRAVAIITGPSSVSGIVNVIENSKLVTIHVRLTGVPPGNHGFHVHEFGDLSNGCESAGEHFNPFLTSHGAPWDPVRHVGDLGNVEADVNGTVNMVIRNKAITLNGPLSVVGRSFVVHENEDDLGRGKNLMAKVSGNSGRPIACGVIGIAAA